jgi:phosphatidate cytidylyltransferase
MKKLLERILIFIIGIPIVITLVLFDYCNNLAMNIVIVLASGIGTLELSSMMEKKQIRISKIESFILGALAPLAVMLNMSFAVPSWIIPVIIMSGFGWALVSGIFTGSSQAENAINKVIGRFGLLVYPGFFMCWLIKMNIWENKTAILLFLCITFAYDSIAWLFGSLFGSSNRGIIPVSPNKSIAGFVGGLLGSVLISVSAALAFPSYFSFYYETPVPTALMISIVLGLCTGFAAIFGDLAESAIKRSCDFKDSGKLMLGRGGVLDSIDSIALAAPVFFLLFTCFFNVC